MTNNLELNKMPDFDELGTAIASLNLPISVSELHGVMCGYLCAGEAFAGEQYLRALLLKHNDESRKVALLIHQVYTYSQHQLENFDFSFTMALPDDFEDLTIRAQAFVNWCEGFTQGMALSKIVTENLNDEETMEAISHIADFAQMDLDEIDQSSKEDDRQLMEISEYTRMAVLSIYSELNPKKPGKDKANH